MVANHPHGLSDGIMFGELLTRVREDVRILANEQLSLCQELEPVSYTHLGSRSVGLCGKRVLGEELTRPQVNDHVSTIAAIPEVRSLLLSLIHI